MENWKAIEGYEGLYEVSDLGRVRSLDRLVIDTHRNGKPRHKIFKGKILTPQLEPAKGYYHIRLSKQDGGHSLRVAPIVAKAFIPNLENKPEVNHKNGKQKWNNAVSNLEWATKSENEQHASKNLLKVHGSEHSQAKLSESDIPKIRALRSSGLSLRVIADRFDVCHKTILNIVKGSIWKHA